MIVQSKKLKRRLGIATQKLKLMKNLWNGGNEKTKLKFVKTLIFPIATFGSETLSLSNAAEQKINTFEMRMKL